MNRSKDLAIILGIRPEIRPSFDNGIICTSDLREFYPDFEEPNNFVKLLELLNKYIDIRCESSKSVIPQIIDKAIYVGTTNRSRFINKKEEFKQQAQLVNWEF